MPKRLDLIGKKYGRLTVIKFHDVQHGMSRWECRCACGNETIAYGRHMISGNTLSCGCLGKERRLESCTKHGLSHTRIYQVWADMHDRCRNPNNVAYKWYGGKGVKVCDEWKDAGVFAEWAYQNGYADTLTIDRIDSNKDYEPSNCQWIPQKENTLKAIEYRSDLHWGKNLDTGEYYEFTLMEPFARQHGIRPRKLTVYFRGECTNIPGWEFGIVA